MKTKHDGDCSIYAALDNIGMPEAGICTCGYGHQYKYSNDGDDKEMYSDKLREKYAEYAEELRKLSAGYPQ